MRYKIIISLLLISLFSQAQEKIKDRSGFTYGGGVGIMMASGKNAMFYNGSDDKQNAVINVIGNPLEPYNSTESSLRSQFYDVIKDSVIGIQYPTKMTYNPAVRPTTHCLSQTGKRKQICPGQGKNICGNR